MLKMLIVEDERWEREGLMDFLDWERMGIEIAGTACDGIDGLEKAREIRPDIIITDIRMPGMDGLKMSRKIRNFLPEARIIVLTGYSDFQYAREAIQFQVDDYVLKPVEEEQMRETIGKVVEKCRQEREWRKEKENLEQLMKEGGRLAADRHLTDLIAGRMDPVEALAELNGIGVQLEDRDVVVAVIAAASGPAEQRIQAQTGHLCHAVPTRAIVGGLVLFFPLEEDEMSLIRQGLEAMAGELSDIGVIGLGHPARAGRPDQIPSSFEQALAAADYGVFYERRKVIPYGRLEEEGRRFSGQAHAFMDQWHDHVKQVRTAALSLQSDRVEQELDEMFRLIGEHPGAGKDYASTLLSGLLVEISTLEDRQDLRFKEESGDLRELIAMERLADMCDYVRDYLHGLLLRLKEKRSNKDEFIVEKVIRLIEAHYHSNDLSMTMLAEHVFMSPNHLGVVFKKNMGRTIHNYIMEFRMNKAEELLRTTTKKVSEIAGEVGVFNFSYFCTLFKQAYGMTPGEYQEFMRRR